MAGRQQPRRIDSAADAVADERIRAFGVMLTTTSLLERLLGTAMERDSGLSHSMFEVLLLVGARPEGVPMGELSRRLVLTSGGATRLVDRMVEAGLVARERSRDDRRVQVVTLTPDGAGRLVQAARRHAAELDRHVYGVLPPEPLAAVVDGLDRLGRHVNAVLPPLG